VGTDGSFTRPHSVNGGLMNVMRIFSCAIPLPVVTFGLAVVASVLYSRITARLECAGVVTNGLLSLGRTIGAFRVYRQLAPENEWPTWPLAAYGVASLGAILVGATFFSFASTDDA
jgi:hypothetical protein